MQYQIDQSGKIERTSKTTVIAYANGSVRSLKISALEKQKLIQAMKPDIIAKANDIMWLFYAK